jgi:acyl carrier protein
VKQDEIAARLEEFVRGVGQVSPDDGNFGRDAHLFEAAYLDSLGVLRMIEFLEQTYRIRLSDQELYDDRFTTIRGISAIVGARFRGETP